MMRKKVMAVLAGAAMLVAASAQDVPNSPAKVSGIVRDTKGIPVTGAVVMLDGDTSLGTVTDMEGKYILTIPNVEGASLNVSCLSYVTQVVPIQGRAIVDVVLTDDLQKLEDAVVIGYGAMRKSDLTGAVSSIKIDDDEAAQAASVDQLLRGNAAGVQVVSNSSAPGAGISVLVRGASSFNGSSQPLYVLDGIILNTDSNVALITQGEDSRGGDEATNGLMGINPQDVASVEVLKDASATAIYGSQGANGVVLITTKTATRSKPYIHYNGGLFINTPSKKLNVMNFNEYINYLQLRRSLGGDLANSATQIIRHAYENPDDTSTGLLVTPVNWQDYLMHTTVNHSHYVSVTGKTADVSYLFSLTYKTEDGIVRNTGYDNFAIRLNLDYAVSKSVSLGTRSVFTWLNTRLTQGASTSRAGAASSMMRSMLVYYPWMRNGEDIDSTTLANDDMSSPTKWLDDFEQGRVESRISPSVFLEWKISPSFSFKSTAGGDYRSSDQNKFKSYRINTSTEGSIGAIARTSRLAYNFDNQINFSRDWYPHKLSGTIGMSMSKNTTNVQTIEGWNIEQWRRLTESLNSAPNTGYTYSINDSSLMSVFGRAVYSFRDRYIATATLRYDGSSKFRGTNRWALFPSFALAWRISEEPWFNTASISSLKLRAGWGQVGNQAISSYQTISNFAAMYYPDHSLGNTAQSSLAMFPSNIANKKLKWETSEQYNLGVDLGLWQGRVSVSAELYEKMTKNLLQQKYLAASSGFNVMWMNMGSIRNRGLEFTLDSVPVRANNFEWSVAGNLSLNRNKIIRIGEGSESGSLYLHPGVNVRRNYFWGRTVSVSYLPYALNLFVEGEPMSVFYGMPTDGILKEGETGVPMSDGQSYGPGQIKYIDTNGDGIISDMDRVIIGDPNPDFTYGFNTQIKYKRVSLKLTFNGSYGSDIYNINKMFSTNVTVVNNNLFRDVVRDAWSPSNQDTWYTSLDGLNATDIRWVVDRYVEDGSYLRLSGVSFNYRVPLKSHVTVKSLQLGVSGNNLIVWTRYSGWDPDVNSFGSVLLKGADMGSYPSAMTIRFDLKIGF